MAKQKVETFIFQPGIPLSGNRFPNAYELIKNNIEFIKDETVAWIASQVTANGSDPTSIWYNYTYNSPKCERDTGYNLEGTDGNGGIIFDMRYGGNAQARFLASKYWINSTPQLDGTRETEIAAKNFVVSLINNYLLPQLTYTSLQSPVVTTQYKNSGIAYESGADTRVTNLFFIITDVIQNGLDNVPALQRSQISSVKMQTRVPTNDLLLITDTTNNEVLFNFSDPELGASTSFQTDDTTLLTKGVEEDFPKFLEKTGTVTTVFLNKSTDNPSYSPKAVAVLNANKSFLQKETLAYVANAVSTATAGSTFDGYSYNSVAMERDIGQEITAMVNDIQYGGNGYIYDQVKTYWVQTTPMITGTRTPEVTIRNWLKDLINNYVLKNTLWTTLQTGGGAVTQNTILSLPENGVDTRVTQTYKIVTDVITNGLDALPTVERIPLYHTTDDIQIFIDQGEMRVRPFDFGTDAIERMRVSNSISMLDADFEYGLQPTKWQAIAMQRGYPSIYEVPGTDKEVASVKTDASTGTGGVGQSLITVTTVGAHGIETGTPITIKALENSVQGASRAEGSFIVSTVPTNNTFTYFAKSKVGTSNNQILSTYYTQLREGGFYTGAAIGTPTFTILSQGTAGVFTNPLGALNGSDKVTWIGNTPEIGAPMQNVSGQIATVNTYSAANASRTPGTYTVTNANSSSVVAELIVGSFTVVVDGSGAATASNFKGGRNNQVGDTITVPDNALGGGGAPDLTFLVATVNAGTGIASGAQVSVVTGGGGEIATLSVASDLTSGVNQIPVSDVTGILVGQAIDRGDGNAVHVSSIVGNNVNLDGNTTTDIVGNNVNYTGVAGVNVVPQGNGATFDIDRAGGSYTAVLNGLGGNNYAVGDVIIVLGNLLGGQATTNDCRITVDSTDSSGSVVTFTVAGTAFDGTGSYANVAGDNLNGQGLGAIFDLTYTNNAFSVSLAQPTYANNGTGVTQGGTGTGAAWDITLASNNYTVTENSGATDAGYVVGDAIKINGTEFGGDATNDLTISITGVDGSGGITSFTSAGTGPDASNQFTEPAYSYGGIGTNASVNVNFTGSTYGVTLVNPGSGYSASETLVIAGTNLGGQSPANDATVTIDAVDGSGVITTISITGTAVNSRDYSNITSGQNLVGAAATFNVTVNYNNSYTVTQGNEPGQNYANGNTIVIAGNNLGGTTPANDLTITVTGINASTGAITSFSSSGTAADATSGYAAGDRLKILGTSLGGASPANDALVKVDAVSGTGRINTISVTGTAPDATESYTNPSYTSNTIGGAGAEFLVTRLDTAYSATISAGGTGYLTGEEFVVLGSALGGIDVTHNATITISAVDAGTGEVTGVTVAGTALDTKTITQLSQFDGEAINQTGSTATFDVSLSAGSYTVTVNTPGLGYYVDQSIRIQGATLGGASPANDVTISITSVDASGAITGISSTGTAPGGTASYTAIGGQNLDNLGEQATFNITRNGGSYSTAQIAVDGINYQVGNKIKVVGSALGGTDVTNDVIINITEVATDGGIVAVTSTGTAVAGTVVKTYSTVTMTENLVAAIPQNYTLQFSALATVEVTFTTAHGLIPGDSFLVTVSTDDGTNNHTLLEGPFFAQQVPTVTSLRYQCRAAGAISAVGDINAVLYPRPDSFFVHRPYDGGVQLGTGGPQHGAQAIRQSKKYIRYQSGKGIMYTTGALFAPSYDLLNVSADAVTTGSFINVTTDDVDHGLQVGGQIKLIGIETPGYNGEYTVSAIVSEREFKVIAQTDLGSTTPILSPKAQVSLLYWHGATVRSGAFDDQNGIFMEYDGSNFNAVQRTATLQLSGVISIGVDSNAVTGIGTRFRDQVKAGDRIVIKGMTHVVSQVNSQTSMNVTPDFRGVTPASGAKLCLVADKKSKQADFNGDVLDGTGSSGYIMDISKMQMIGIQYSWYGAGFIDWMLRGDDGNFIFYHRMRNSNVNTEAFMRTGNMPVRYEVTNEGPNDRLGADMTDSQTTIPLENASFFPTSGGTVMIDNEMIQYTGINGDTLTGCTRSAPLTNFAAGATRTYTAGVAATHTARTGVILISNTITPIISHWGSAFQTDGGFDSDRGYIFSYTSTGNVITSTRNTVFMLRLAPSVSNAIVGDLGERELLNRAQLLLEGIEITSDGVDGSNNPISGGIVVEGILNPQNYPLDPGDVGWAPLTGAAAGGQPSFAQVAPGGSVTWSTGATQVIRNATTVAEMTLDVTSSYSRNNTNYHFVSSASFNNANNEGLQTGITVTATSNAQSGNSDFPAGTTLAQIYSYYNPPLLRFSNRNTATISSGETITMSINPTGALEKTNFLYFTKASWEATGAISGTEVSDSKFPGGTYVSGVSGPLTFGGVEYYRITFTQSSLQNITAGSTVGFLFGQPPYALPGETVFSFIATPGEQSSLMLGTLKELTNTTLGGRGTFPNGPDVLAINVYKASGAQTNANIIIRWGEAQA
tara:strand:+ start:30567 stop:37946 length:7380 start_codon:yes stop_codon:yes gene_type:complete